MRDPETKNGRPERSMRLVLVLASVALAGSFAYTAARGADTAACPPAAEVGPEPRTLAEEEP